MELSDRRNFSTVYANGVSCCTLCRHGFCARRGSKRKGCKLSHRGSSVPKILFMDNTTPNSMPVSQELNQKWDAWVKGGVLCSEMEASTLFVVGSYRKLRTGALLVVYGDQNRQEALSKEEYLESVNIATNIILEASLKIPN